MERPSAEQIESYRKDGTLQERIEFAKTIGNQKFSPEAVARLKHKVQVMSLLQKGFSPKQAAVMAPPPARQGLPTSGTVKVLALLIEFSDYPHSVSSVTINSALFGDGNFTNFPKESLRNYYRRSSYGQSEIHGNTLGWYNTGHPRSDIPKTDSGRENIIKQALNYYESQGHDFSQYDNDGDGSIDYLAVMWTGPDCGWNCFWWGYATEFTDSSYSLDGKKLSRYSWQWESSSPLTVIHETGHAFGLPDYYDYDSSKGPDGGVGGLDMMDGNWGDHNCFSKFMLDWLTPVNYNADTHSITLRASDAYGDSVKIIPGGSADNPFEEFFMVQNRQRSNNDTTYPNDGLLIWHVDARLNGDGTNFLYDNSYTEHKLLRLMEADGLEEIEQSKVANAGDYYTPGKNFDSSSSPNSEKYDGSTTGVFVNNITATGNTMSFYTGTSDTPHPSVSVNYPSMTLPPGQQQTVTFTVANSGVMTSNLGGYLSISLSAGLDIIGYSSDHDPTMQYSHKQPGESGWDKNQQQISLSYELLDAYETYSAAETRKVYVTFKANTNGYGSQWIKYRATFEDSQSHYVNNPLTGDTDQQGWNTYQIAVNGGSPPNSGTLLVNDSASPPALQISATPTNFSSNYSVALKNSGGQAISVSVSKTGSNLVTLNAPTSFSIGSNLVNFFYFTVNVPAGTPLGNYNAQLSFTYNGGTIYLPVNITVTQYQPGTPTTVNCNPSSGQAIVLNPFYCSVDISSYYDRILNGLVSDSMSTTFGKGTDALYYSRDCINKWSTHTDLDSGNVSLQNQPKTITTGLPNECIRSDKKLTFWIYNENSLTFPVSNVSYTFTAYDGDPNLVNTKTVSKSICAVNEVVDVTLRMENTGSNFANNPHYDDSSLPLGIENVSGNISGNPSDILPGVVKQIQYQIRATIPGSYVLSGTAVTYENSFHTKNFQTSFNSVSLTAYGGTATPTVSFSSSTLKVGATETIVVAVLDSITGSNIPDATVIGTLTSPDSKTYQFYLNYDSATGKYIKDFADTLSTGTYSLQVSAERTFYTAGTTSTSPTFTIVSRPTTQLSLAGTAGNFGWYKSDINVILSATGGSSNKQIYYKFDGGTQQTYSTPFSITSDGSHVLEYWTVDVDLPDNDEISHKTTTILIDKLVPISTCSALASYQPLFFTVQWSGSDNGGSQLASYDVQYKAGTGAWTDWEINTNLTSQVFGPASDNQPYYFRVRAKDNAGNVEAYPDTPDAFTTVDVSSPSAPVVTSPTHQAGVWNISSNNPQFNCTAADAGSGVAGYNIVLNRLQSFVPDMVVNLTGNSTTFMNVADGIWYFHARAKDGAGNWGPATTYGPVKIDLYAPNFPGIASSKNPAKEGDITLTVIASEQMSEMTATITQNGSGPISVPLTSQDSITWTGNYHVNSGFDGTATISVSGKDLSGKSGSGSATFEVDTIAPTKPVATSPTHTANIPVSNNIAAFTWSPSSDNSGSGLAGYSYAINQIEDFNLDFTTETVSTSFVSSALPDATYWFHLRAVDNAENGSVVERYKFIVDTTSPTFIASYSCNLCKAGAASLTVTANEPLKQAPQVSVRQNGQGSSTPLTMTSSDNTLWIGGYTVVSEYDGTADVNVTGIDIANNTGPGSGSFQVDTIGPSASIALSPSAPLKTGPFTLNLTITDASAITGTPVLSYSPAGQQPVPVNLSGSNKSWTGEGFIESIRSTGTAIFSFSAIDAAGNEGTAFTSGETFAINTTINGNTGGVVENSDGTNVVVGPGAYNGGLVINIGTPNKTLPGIVEANTNTPKVTPIENQDLYRECTAHDNATNSAVTAFSSPITITMYYPDANNDGIVDGSNIGESRLRLYWLNENNKRWEEVTNAVPDFALKKFSASVTHFSIYSIMAVLPTAGIYPIPWKPGAGGKFDSANVSGCGSGIIFDNLPSEAKISIYNYSGDLIRELNVSSLDNGCKAWNGKNGSGRDVASGIYLAVIKTSSGNTVKKLAIER